MGGEERKEKERGEEGERVWMKTTTTIHPARHWHPTRGRVTPLYLTLKRAAEMTPDDPFCLPHGRHVVTSGVTDPNGEWGIPKRQLERSGIVPCCSRDVEHRRDPQRCAGCAPPPTR